MPCSDSLSSRTTPEPERRDSFLRVSSDCSPETHDFIILCSRTEKEENPVVLNYQAFDSLL